MNSVTGNSDQPTLASSVLFTGFAMLAFAANSVLCRMALGGELIDAASFTTVRMISGAVCLIAIVLVQNSQWRPSQPNWISVISLFAYMVFFSFAYRSLSAGTGALLLFGFVQITMVGIALARGDRLSPLAWVGLMLAMSGLIYLVLPGVESPDILYSVLMAVAGIAWGSYSLLGKSAGNPTIATANNFFFAIPFVVLVSIIDRNNFSISSQGFLLAIVSGAVTSGLGYAVWYRALKGIKATSAATVQLSVPALATLGGVLLLSEPVTARIVIAILMTIGGIAIVLHQPVKSPNNEQ